MVWFCHFGAAAVVLAQRARVRRVSSSFTWWLFVIEARRSHVGLQRSAIKHFFCVFAFNMNMFGFRIN